MSKIFFSSKHQRVSKLSKNLKNEISMSLKACQDMPPSFGFLFSLWLIFRAKTQTSGLTQTEGVLVWQKKGMNRQGHNRTAYILPFMPPLWSIQLEIRGTMFSHFVWHLVRRGRRVSLSIFPILPTSASTKESSTVMFVKFLLVGTGVLCAALISPIVGRGNILMGHANPEPSL